MVKSFCLKKEEGRKKDSRNSQQGFDIFLADSSFLSALSTPSLSGTWPQTWMMACCMSSLSKSTPPVGEARWFWTRQECLSKALPAIYVYFVQHSYLLGGRNRDTKEGGGPECKLSSQTAWFELSFISDKGLCTRQVTDTHCFLIYKLKWY